MGVKRYGNLVLVSAGAARDNVGDDGEGVSSESGPDEPEGVAVLERDAVLGADRVLCLYVYGSEDGGANSEAEGTEESGESGKEEGKAGGEEANEEREASEHGSDKDEVEGRESVVGQVARVTESRVRDKVGQSGSRSVGRVGEDGIKRLPLVSKCAVNTAPRGSRLFTGTVVVETPGVVVLDTLSLGHGGILVGCKETAGNWNIVGRGSIGNVESVDGNKADVARNNVVGQLTNVGQDDEDCRGKSEELGCSRFAVR